VKLAGPKASQRWDTQTGPVRRPARTTGELDGAFLEAVACHLADPEEKGKSIGRIPPSARQTGKERGSEALEPRQARCRAIGATLVAIGAATTIPAAVSAIHGLRQSRRPSWEDDDVE